MCRGCPQIANAGSVHTRLMPDYKHSALASEFQIVDAWSTRGMAENRLYIYDQA